MKNPAPLFQHSHTEKQFNKHLYSNTKSGEGGCYGCGTDLLIVNPQPLHGRGRQAAWPQPQAPGRSPIGQGKASLTTIGGGAVNAGGNNARRS